MDTVRKYKTLVSIIVFLLITNFAMLIFFMVIAKPIDKKSRYNDQNGFGVMLQNEVGFSKTQLDQYQALRTQQRQNVKPLFDDIRKSKDNFYGLLYSDSVPDSVIDANADSIAETQKKLDLQMFNHFKNIRSLCTPDQLQKFDSSIKKAVARMTGRPGKGKPN